MNFKGIIFFLIAFCHIVQAMSQPTSVSEVDSVLASVNGEPVCLSDILPVTRGREYQIFLSHQGKPPMAEIEKLRFEAVEEFINRKLVIADFKEHQFKLSPNDVEYEIDRAAQRLDCFSRKELIRKLHSQGYSFEQFRQDIENNMRYQFMAFRQYSNTNTVTPRDVFEYFQKNQKKYAAPAQVELGMLRLDAKISSEEQKSVADSLKNDPKQFELFTKKYSTTPSMGLVECSKLRPEFLKAIADFKRKDIIGPIQLDGEVIYLKIIKFIPAENGDFNQLSTQIRKELIEAKRRKMWEFYMAELRKKAVITYFIVKAKSNWSAKK